MRCDSSRPTASALLLGMLVLSSGCGNERFSYAPVEGVVTLDGNPLSTARVIFAPQPDGTKDGQTGKLSFGVTDQSGRFTLESVGGDKGARVGPHLVAILGEIRDEANPEKVIKPEFLPARYHKGKTLTFDVPPSGTTEANFSLDSDKKR